jgi:hypothetical protein
MAGLFTAWWQAAAFAGAFAGVLLLRTRLPLVAKPWLALIKRVPLLMRLLVAFGFSYLFARALIGAEWSNTDSFLPVLVSATAPLLIAALLLPAGSSYTLGGRDRPGRRGRER